MSSADDPGLPAGAPVDSAHELALIFGIVGMFALVGGIGWVSGSIANKKASRMLAMKAREGRLGKVNFGTRIPRAVLSQTTAGTWLMAIFFVMYLSARSYDQFGVFHPDMSGGQAIVPIVMAFSLQLLRSMIDAKADTAKQAVNGATANSYAVLQILATFACLTAALMWEACITGALTFKGRYWLTGSLGLVGLLLMCIRVALRESDATDSKNDPDNQRVAFIGTYYIGITTLDAWYCFATTAVTALTLLIVYDVDAKEPLYAVTPLALIPIYIIVCTVANWNQAQRTTASSLYNLVSALLFLTAIIMVPVIHYSAWKHKGIILFYSVGPVIVLYSLGLATSVPSLLPTMSYECGANPSCRDTERGATRFQ